MARWGRRSEEGRNEGREERKTEGQEERREEGWEGRREGGRNDRWNAVILVMQLQLKGLNIQVGAEQADWLAGWLSD